MSNPLKGEAPLVLEDGRSFTLVLDFAALIAAESRYGKPLAFVLAEANAGFVGATLALLWGAMQRHHADLTVDEVTDLLAGNLDQVQAAVTAAGEAALPAPAEGDNRGNAKKRRAGKRSGHSGAKPG